MSKLVKIEEYKYGSIPFDFFGFTGLLKLCVVKKNRLVKIKLFEGVKPPAVPVREGTVDCYGKYRDKTNPSCQICMEFINCGKVMRRVLMTPTQAKEKALEAQAIGLEVVVMVEKSRSALVMEGRGRRKHLEERTIGDSKEILYHIKGEEIFHPESPEAFWKKLGA